MTPIRKKRLTLILLMIVGIGLAAFLASRALDENLMFFYEPSQIVAGEAPKEHPIRVGGLVVNGSIQRRSDGLTVAFDVTDNAEKITVEYTGILPDLFREGQGIVALGKLNDKNIFVASEVLAKHDENYMPPEVASALKNSHDKGTAAPTSSIN